MKQAMESRGLGNYGRALSTQEETVSTDDACLTAFS